jgi:hypothetical protein
MAKISSNRPEPKYGIKLIAAGALGVISALLIYPMVGVLSTECQYDSSGYGCSILGILVIALIYLVLTTVVLRLALKARRAFSIVMLSIAGLFGVYLLAGHLIDYWATPANLYLVFLAFALINGILFAALYYLLGRSRK